jgi:NTP pyrophosphohydrolases including oxidative damage repair enzymes
MMTIKRLINTGLAHYTSGWTREEPTERPIQTGALPWRLGPKKRIEVLLVTGRRSRRWTIPKGWPMTGKSLAEAAAVEAFEEAGVKGKIQEEPLGAFNYTKQSFPFGSLEVRILVHELSVERELDKWPELGQRRRKWFSAEEAAEKVQSEELRSLIIDYAERASSTKSAKKPKAAGKS